MQQFKRQFVVFLFITLFGIQSSYPEVPLGQIDELMNGATKPNEPGAAVLVVKDGKTLIRKAYGMADMELGISMNPDFVFRLGSITKQFTAVATLMLMERGKLALDDEITKYLPDFPVKGKRITIRHLLTHS